MTTAYMPLYIGDIKRKTDDLGPTEYGIYARLIEWAWDHEGTIPLDRRKLCNITRCSPHLWKRVGAPVVEQFFDSISATHAIQKRVLEELLKYREKCSKNSAAALRMHSKRRANAGQTHMQSESESIEEREASPLPAAAGPSPDSSAERSEAVTVKAVTTKVPRVQAARLPDDWMPQPATINLVAKMGWSGGAFARELERFKRHYKTASGNRGLSRDWDVSFISWLDKDWKNPQDNVVKSKLRGWI